MSARRYTKEDVEFHAKGYHGAAAPAVNVKVYSSVGDVLRFPDRYDLDLGDDADDFLAWARELYDNDRFPEHMWDFAIESGWELLQSDAEDIFGPRVSIRSEGRQGGWCCVDGLPELDDWDAVLFSKWRKFERWAKSAAAEIPADMVRLLYINDWEWRQADKAKRDLAMEEATTLGTAPIW